MRRLEPFFSFDDKMAYTLMWPIRDIGAKMSSQAHHHLMQTHSHIYTHAYTHTHTSSTRSSHFTPHIDFSAWPPSVGTAEGDFVVAFVSPKQRALIASRIEQATPVLTADSTSEGAHSTPSMGDDDDSSVISGRAREERKAKMFPAAVINSEFVESAVVMELKAQAQAHATAK